MSSTTLPVWAEDRLNLPQASQSKVCLHTVPGNRECARRERELAQATRRGNRRCRSCRRSTSSSRSTDGQPGEITSLREETLELAELLVRLADDAAVGVIDFKDRCDPRALRGCASASTSSRSVRLVAFARSMRAGIVCSVQPDPRGLDYAQARRAAVDANWPRRASAVPS